MNENTKIIDLARAKDPDAFCAVYDLHKDALYRYALYRLGSREDAEDAVQECVMSAWQQIGNLKSSEALRSWLFKILAGCCSRRIRSLVSQREKIDAVTDALSAGQTLTGTGDPQGAVTDSIALNQALDLLADEERSIVLLSVVGGFTSEEISEMTGIRPGSVRSKLSRSLKKMRNTLEGTAQQKAGS